MSAAASISVTDVRFTAAPQIDQLGGLLGWVAADIGGALRVDGFAVRRTRMGDYRVFPPERRDRAGRLHRIVRLHDDQAEKAIEQAILRALAEQRVLP